MLSPGLNQAAADLLTELCQLHPMGYRPHLFWRAYRVSAGMAYYRTGSIGLSNLVIKEEQQMRTTLIHEYAHLLAMHRHGRKAAGHGAPWRQAMIDLGAEPKVRHNYQVFRNIARQQVTYLCLRCGADIQRARRLPGRRKYVHAACGGDLRLKQVVKG